MLKSPTVSVANHTHKSKRIQKNEGCIQILPDNMLPTQSKINQQAPTAGGSGTLVASSASSPSAAIANIKCEPFSSVSPLNDSAKNQTMLDETRSSSVNLSTDSCTKSDRDCSVGPTAVSTPAMRQKSLISSSNTANVSSPNNSSDQSNSSNVSPNLVQPIDNSATDIIGDLSNSKNNTKIQKSTLCTLTTAKEENGLKTTLDKSGNLHGSSTKSLVCTNAALNLLSSVKDEADSMTSTKKEESSISPAMSPAGFGSIPALCRTSSVEVRSCTPAILDEGSKSKTVNPMHNNNKVSLISDEKTTSVLGALNNCGPNGCGSDSVSLSEETQFVASTSTESLLMGGAHCSAIPIFNNNSSFGGSTGNGMEYMQQQNHIFVFSTQLANKGAESVLSGQFPTIIKYHCTQPATKTFLEDFFIKNPMKMCKLQRQTSGGLCSIPGNVNGPQWIGNCNTVSQMSQKSNGNKISFTGSSINLDNKESTRQPAITSFSEAPEALGANENDLMCWEQTRNNVDEVLKESNTGKGVSSGVDGSTGCSSASRSTLPNNIGGGTDSGTPSLQGIKVPDENLTPQQRQHREEQLAKLKQIDQFLSNPLQSGNHLAKLGTESAPANLSGLMLNLTNPVPAGLGTQLNSSLNSNLRNISNAINSSSQNICNRENIAMPLMEENVVQSDTIHGNDIESVACRSSEGIQINIKSNISCRHSAITGDAVVSNGVGNALPCLMGAGNNIDASGESNEIGGSSIMPNSPEMLANFNTDGNLESVPEKAAGTGNIHSHEMGQVGISQIDWCKFQHQLFEERIKTKSQGTNESMCMPSTLPRSNSTICNANARFNSSICVSSSSANTTPATRTSQGPPPPYHPTQRSASVPIATQSPNPASPNNPTSHRSLPSPRTSTVSGRTESSPNVDSITSTSHALTTTSSMSAPISNPSNHTKNSFQPEGSPPGCGTNKNSNNFIRNNKFNSNPSTPISHTSPKDLEPFQSNISAGDFKTTRPSPQRARTPVMTSSDGNIVDSANIESNFSTTSPGLSFTHQMTNTSSYKGPSSNEHQTTDPVPLQFCRRTDNLPFNPNSSRLSQKKLSLSFDPISSLAQMSQQLTSCVSINSNSVGNISGSGMNDVNVSNSNNQNMEGVIRSMDSGVNHCTTTSSGNIGMSQHISGHGPFMPNNCHINTMLGSIGQRMLNPKVCAGFGHSTGGIGRDGSGGMHGVVQTHRLIGRMGMNFGNFNVSPNIQVKASTPNTIQYMPMRSQNNSNSMRVPPSLEFLRYANTQIPGPGNIVEHSRICHGNAISPSDPGKINNSNNGPTGGGTTGIDFFMNCTQIDSLAGDQEDLVAANINNGTHQSIPRAIRPIRHSVHQMIPVSRMHVPILTGHFLNESQSTMECGESSLFIGNDSNGNGPRQDSPQIITGTPSQSQIYAGTNNLQKSIKPVVASNMCQNINIQDVSNVQISANGNISSNEHISPMPPAVNSAIMIGNTTGMLSNTMQVGNNVSPSGCGGRSRNSPAEIGSVGYKPFVGPASSDVKYAQQYHSFQQQLYATSTRSQNAGNNNIMSNESTNPTFFSNK